MQIFDETENRYYEWLSWLANARVEVDAETIRVLAKEDYMGQTVPDFLPADIFQSMDHTVLERLSEIQEEEEPHASTPFPVRATDMEREAWHNLMENPYTHQFLRKETWEKLRSSWMDANVTWSELDIQIRNQFSGGQSQMTDPEQDKIRSILQAIRERRILICNHIRPNRFAFYDSVVYPVRMEYSMQNDMFRVSVYVPAQDEFIQMNVIYLTDIRLGQEHFQDMDGRYKAYLEEITRSVTLEVEANANAIERCFRLFSYHNREASYDPESGQYRLTLEYYAYDENEIIRDILSLGSRVVVVEPSCLRTRVRDRIQRAIARYEK